MLPPPATPAGCQEPHVFSGDGAQRLATALKKKANRGQKHREAKNKTKKG